MEMQEFVNGCRSCNPAENPEQAAELLRAAAELGEAILKKRKRESGIKYQDYADAYNNCCGMLPKITKLTDKRKRAIKTYVSSGGSLETFTAVVSKAAVTPFLTGSNDRNWFAGFDFIIKPDNIAKINENVYGAPMTRRPEEHSYNLDTIINHAINNTPK